MISGLPLTAKQMSQANVTVLEKLSLYISILLLTFR